MYSIKTFIAKAAQIVRSKHVRIAIMALTIALFVLSAGAPNAMGGIGK